MEIERLNSLEGANMLINLGEVWGRAIANQLKLRARRQKFINLFDAKA